MNNIMNTKNMTKEQKCNDINRELVADLTCTICREFKETYSDIVYSQGSRVCLECKTITLESDKKAFDRYMRLR